MRDFVRGNQLYSHWFLMLGQSLKQTFRLGFYCGFIVFIYLSVQTITLDMVKKSLYYGQAKILHSLPIEGAKNKINIKDNLGYNREVSTYYVIHNPLYLTAIKVLEKNIKTNLLKAWGFSWSTVICLMFIWNCLGKYQRREKIERKFNQLLSASAASRRVKKLFGSSLKLGNLALPKKIEEKHFLILGGTGVGKSNCINDLLLQIRKAKQKVIILDSSGYYISRFYREGKDIILNPSDTRSRKWNLWCDARNRKEFQNVASYAIPTAHSDRYWTDAARQLLASLLEKLKVDGLEDNDQLSKILINYTPRDLAKFLKGFPSEPDMRTSDNTANSIRSVLVSSTQWIHDLDQKADFSISKWLEDKDDSWLFLSTAYDERKSNMNLLNLQFQIALQRLGRLGEDPKRTVWFIGDELDTLKDPENIVNAVTEIRKYGGRLVLATQTLSQLNTMFGHDRASTILSNIGTKIFFRIDDNDTSKWVSTYLGEMEVTKKKESYTFGGESYRDGVSLGEHKETKFMIYPEEIRGIEPLNAYLCLKDAKIVTKVKFKYKDFDKLVPAFIPKEIEVKENAEKVLKGAEEDNTDKELELVSEEKENSFEI